MLYTATMYSLILSANVGNVIHVVVDGRRPAAAVVG